MTASFLDDRFFAALETSVAALEEAETLPPACYTDAAFYEFEKEALFNHEWLCVGREEQVKAAGDYFTTSIVGEPLVIVRDRAGQVRALSSVCQHRAMLVAEGEGNTRGFVCPYHHWTYDLDGKLVGAPAMDRTCNFDKQSFNLPELKVEIWQGFVFVNFDAEAAPLAPRLATIESHIAGYDLPSAELAQKFTGDFAWNWKVMFENNNDGYHASKLHQGPLHDFIPSHLASFPEADPDDAGFLRLNGALHQDPSFNPTQKAILPVFPGLTDEE
ncbi:MAG TPA: aromatic ring-hydroxylating dioxygenase subunit alpha, partial [Novosphingobium sp.]|nr:aromatic ring-hydroxylating dioxygenase subunit alpha [Novosphingobium sp.]